MIGKQILQYVIKAKLGEGGRGTVYLAEDTKLQRPVALKFLKNACLKDSETRQRFLFEAQAAAKLNHPNIVTIFEINQHEDELFISMEYIDGMTLIPDILKDIPETDRTALLKQILFQLADALNEAHDKGIIHRDIKPQNVMLDDNGTVKILDFGLAVFKGRERITEDYTIKGTLQYLSPESIENNEVDLRTDIWSFGALMYELCYGIPAFEGDSVQATIHRVLNEEPDYEKPQYCTGLNAPELIRRCLMKAPGERIQSFRDICDCLESVDVEDSHSTRTVSGPTAIAVLPFSDLSPGRDQEYFCDGIAEELIYSLSKVPKLKVSARTSSFQFKGKQKEMNDIKESLQVNYVLDGSVRKSGNKLRVSVQLMDTKGGWQIWSDRFDRELDDIFVIQDKIAIAVVENLKITLLGEEKRRLTRRYTDNLEAYNLYLEGRFYWNRRYEGDLKRSLDLFREAILRDPRYIFPYIGIADALNILGFYGYIHPNLALSESDASIHKALEIDPEAGEAYCSLGWTHTFFKWDWLAAETYFKKSMDLVPEYATAFEWYSLFLVTMGKFDRAYEIASAALQKDPLSLIINSTLGFVLLFSKRYDEAIAQLEKVLDRKPDFYLARIWLGEAYLFKKEYDEAIKVLESVNVATDYMPYALGDLALAYALSGKDTELNRLKERFLKNSDKSGLTNLLTSFFYFGTENNERVFHYLHAAIDNKEPFCLWLKAAPHFDSIRFEPTFSVLLERMNFPAGE